jgi:hypothetical protein
MKVSLEWAPRQINLSPHLDTSQRGEVEMAEDVPPERPSEVEPGLWVCSEAAVPAALADRNLGITHLISIGYPPPENPAGAARGGDDEDGGG